MTEVPSVVDKEQILYRAVSDTQYGRLTLAKIPVTEQYFGDYTLEAEAINHLYRTYNKPITKNALIMYTKKALASRNKLTSDTELKIENQINKIYELQKKSSYLNDKSIKDAITEWSRQTIATSALTRLISSGADFGKQETLLKAQDIIKESLNVTNTIDGFETFDMFNDSVDTILKEFNSAYHNTISLGWTELDRYMNGGLSKGEMAMIVARAGTGKTQTLMNIAKQYIEYGRRDVVYFALEEKPARMIGRFLSLLGDESMGTLVNFTEKHINYSRNKVLLERLRSEHKKGLLGNFTLAKSTPHTETVESLEQYLVNYGSVNGKMPDVVIVDYPSLLNNGFLSNKVSEYSAEGMLFEQLRGLADRTNTIMWVANQANRMADTAETITSFNMEGSKQKLNTVELCLSLNQSKKEKENGYIRFHIDKARNATAAKSDDTIYMKVNSKSISYENETNTDREHHEEIVKDSANNHMNIGANYQTRSDSQRQISGREAIEKANKAHENNMKRYQKN